MQSDSSIVQLSKVFEHRGYAETLMLISRPAPILTISSTGAPGIAVWLDLFLQKSSIIVLALACSMAGMSFEGVTQSKSLSSWLTGIWSRIDLIFFGTGCTIIVCVAVGTELEDDDVDVIVGSGRVVAGGAETGGPSGGSTGGTPALGTASHATPAAKIAATTVSPALSVVVIVVGVVAVSVANSVKLVA